MPTLEFWLGNEYLHQLTTERQYILRIEITSFADETRHAEYMNFVIGAESTSYMLSIDEFSGANSNTGERKHIIIIILYWPGAR